MWTEISLPQLPCTHKTFQTLVVKTTIPQIIIHCLSFGAGVGKKNNRFDIGKFVKNKTQLEKVSTSEWNKNEPKLGSSKYEMQTHTNLIKKQNRKKN